MNSIIITASGGKFDIMEPHQDDINIFDIAHALSMQCRFNGHCKHFYSVAQHSVRVATILHDAGYGRIISLMGLIHDATEAYIGDVVTPLKAQLENYKAIEARIDQAIHFRFGIFSEPERAREYVKGADIAMLLAERRDLLPESKVEWTIKDTEFDFHAIEEITPLHPRDAESLFLNAFNHLYKGK